MPHRSKAAEACVPYPARCTSLQDQVAWHALHSVLTFTDLSRLAAWTLRDVVQAKSLLEDGEATAAELEPFIGRRWAICRDTPANRGRYGRCLTTREYEDAKRRAFNARVDRLMEEMQEGLATKS